jgi:hypothetical protein
MQDLFGFDIAKEVGDMEGGKYTMKADTPIYTPRSRCPHILELMDFEKTRRLLREIDKSGVSEEEKRFLRCAAHRHTVFSYKKCADYYANASKEMQELMERSALVLIDFDKAIENGFVQLQDDIYKEWLKNKAIQKREQDEK